MSFVRLNPLERCIPMTPAEWKELVARQKRMSDWKYSRHKMIENERRNATGTMRLKREAALILKAAGIKQKIIAVMLERNQHSISRYISGATA